MSLSSIWKAKDQHNVISIQYRYGFTPIKHACEPSLCTWISSNVESYVYLGINLKGPKFHMREAAGIQQVHGFAALGFPEEQCAHTFSETKDQVMAL